MSDSSTQLDLKLWLDLSLIDRQNQLKRQFIEVFEEVGNSISDLELKNFFPESKGKKISKGNDLLGSPYLVLDLVRNFNPETGMNIRLLNWFGYGIYMTIFLGNSIPTFNNDLLQLGYELGLTQKPWDYPEMILEKKTTTSPQEIENRNGLFQTWIKKLPSPPYKEQLESELISEIKKILLLRSKIE